MSLWRHAAPTKRRNAPARLLISDYRIRARAIPSSCPPTNDPAIQCMSALFLAAVLQPCCLPGPFQRSTARRPSSLDCHCFSLASCGPSHAAVQTALCAHRDTSPLAPNTVHPPAHPLTHRRLLWGLPQPAPALCSAQPPACAHACPQPPCPPVSCPLPGPRILCLHLFFNSPLKPLTTQEVGWLRLHSVCCAWAMAVPASPHALVAVRGQRPLCNHMPSLLLRAPGDMLRKQRGAARRCLRAQQPAGRMCQALRDSTVPARCRQARERWVGASQQVGQQVGLSCLVRAEGLLLQTLQRPASSSVADAALQRQRVAAAAPAGGLPVRHNATPQLCCFTHLCT